jgi:hypothetical protein
MNTTKMIPPKVRKHLSADALFTTVRLSFDNISDHRTNPKISLADALMSGFAVFSLKDPSLLAFDERRQSDDPNLNSIYKIGLVPSDTRMREILDEVAPNTIGNTFKDVFSQVQRGKALEPFVYMNGCYLLSIDGTGYFSSGTINSGACMTKKNKKTGKITYYQQMLGGAIVHPDFKEVIPLNPEMIIKQDGETKNDCERNATKRFFKKLRKDHPRLPLIVIEDGLSSNAPHIKDLKAHNLNFILGAKPGDHKFLFSHVASAHKDGKVTEIKLPDSKNPEMTHFFRFINSVPLNSSNQNTLINFLEYQQITAKKTSTFSWVTDININSKNMFKIMRGGRARWKIENETFNTLKNQGYHLEHNFGLGKKHLSENFGRLTMLAFLVDQVQQLCCPLFFSIWEKWKSKRSLWEKIRIFFHSFTFNSMEEMYRALLIGIKQKPPDLL